MDTFVQNVAAAFGLVNRSVTREKFGLLCNTDKGLVMLQKVQGTPANIENILFGHEIKEYLVANGFEGIDRFFVSQQQLPYHKTGADVFTAARAIRADNADFTDKTQFLDVVANIGKMHKILAGMTFPAQPKKRAEPPPAQKALGALAVYRKKLMKAGKFSDFDMMFLKGYEKFVPHILQNDILGHDKYICHNLLKEENIYMQDARTPIFTNFATAGYGHYLSDLVYVVKRYLKANPNGDLPLETIAQTYTTNHPATCFDTKQLKALLQYPDKFVKITKEYYSKKRSFAPKAYLTRMQECLSRGEVLEDYLKLQ